MTPIPLDPQPFVSVVVPCYNSKRTLEECLSSLANQSYPKDRYEVLLVDNGSTDGTCEFVRTSFPWVGLIHSAEKGSGYARNAGIQAALGELILSTDSDCRVDEAWIMNMVTAFGTAPPSVAAVGGKILPYSIKTAVEKHQPAWIAQPDLSRTTTNGRFAATPNAGYRAAVLRLVGGFDGTLGFDDIDLGVRLFKAGYLVEYTDTALVWHRNPARLGELYRHRVKYGRFSFTLNRKHPEIFGDPTKAGAVRSLFLVTLRRVLVDVLVKLPMAGIRPKGRPRIWPLVDAILASGSVIGFWRGSRIPRASDPTASRATHQS